MHLVVTSVPSDLLPFIVEPAVGLRPGEAGNGLAFDTRPLRRATREGKKMELEYRAANGEVTRRIVWPVLLGYADEHYLLIAWCETKRGFRHFRAERILNAALLEDSLCVSRGKLRRQWLQWRENEVASGRR
jgi:predicted DNA-binding transcriptional regulator YafY